MMTTMNPFLVTVLLVVTLLTFVITVVALIDVLKSKFHGNDKLVWVLVLLFLNVVGAILYVAIGRKQKVKDNNVRQ
ncbi:PLDc N-terminal domain-containing protein [Mangrovimonas sp. YM274]|uniref:PLDc N-terminal domain-containing protein n=1 Tax=Mangrovimonas sp. YM274 TaxID=3070660 RepID=UPI0027DD8D7A|nr:PLDc N-terminal domain-containing protein [Mangrovimonas sp. YM274]WMI69169.1 PLDc N-terminal domain-containing protein [Mangrovimonas sp. YM274]